MITIKFSSILIIILVSYVIGFLVALIGRVTSGNDKIKSYNISNKQLNDWVSQYYNNKDYSKLDFTEFVADWLKGEVPPQEMSDNGSVEVVDECKGNCCSCSPVNEDCCNCMDKDGKCHYTINLNTICNVHESVETIWKKRNLLTEDEIRILNNALLNDSKL